MTPAHTPYGQSHTPETRSVVGTVVVGVVAYEVAAGMVNSFLDADVVPSVMPRIQAITPRGIARAVTPTWTRLAAWVAVGAAFGIGAKAAQSALPARLRR